MLDTVSMLYKKSPEYKRKTFTYLYNLCHRSVEGNAKFEVHFRQMGMGHSRSAYCIQRAHGALCLTIRLRSSCLRSSRCPKNRDIVLFYLNMTLKYVLWKGNLVNSYSTSSSASSCSISSPPSTDLFTSPVGLAMSGSYRQLRCKHLALIRSYDQNKCSTNQYWNEYSLNIGTLYKPPNHMVAVIVTCKQGNFFVDWSDF